MAKLRGVLQASAWAGRANSLSPAHVEWSAIDAAAEATWQPEGETEQAGMETQLSWTSLRRRRFGPADYSQINAAALVKQRRSALSLDGSTSISAETFYGMLDRLLPRAGVPPWDVWPWPPHLHCVIFVHRVRGLPSGLYLFERSPTVHARLRSALHPDFLWKRPEGCPKYLPLYELAEGDFREQAQVVSCHQEIAGDRRFSLGMIAEFAKASVPQVHGGIENCFGKPVCLGRCCTWRRRPPVSAARASDVTSTTPFIACSAWAGMAFRACTTLRSEVQ